MRVTVKIEWSDTDRARWGRSRSVAVRRERSQMVSMAANYATRRPGSIRQKFC